MLIRLEALAKRRTALEQEIDGLVAVCRQGGFSYSGDRKRWEAEVSWAEIGDALGVSRQAAQQLYSGRWGR